MMEFEDQEEGHEEDEDEDQEEEEARPFKMPTQTPAHGGGGGGATTAGAHNKTRLSSPFPLSLSIPAGKKPAARYRECLKNHAVGIGGHSVDGCGEFMPAGPDGSLEALRCAACNCHRNFHRKEADPTAAQNQPILQNHHYHQAQPPVSYYPHPHPISQFYPFHQRPLALPSTLGGGREAEDEEMKSLPMSAMGMGSSGKKRFRTKFTAEQKEKMLELAEKMDWRLQKQDEAVVQRFCEETGVKRHALKVWMHNNKHALGKKS